MGAYVEFVSYLNKNKIMAEIAKPLAIQPLFGVAHPLPFTGRDSLDAIWLERLQ